MIDATKPHPTRRFFFTRHKNVHQCLAAAALLARMWPSTGCDALLACGVLELATLDSSSPSCDAETRRLAMTLAGDVVCAHTFSCPIWVQASPTTRDARVLCAAEAFATSLAAHIERDAEHNAAHRSCALRVATRVLRHATQNATSVLAKAVVTTMVSAGVMEACARTIESVLTTSPPATNTGKPHEVVFAALVALRCIVTAVAAFAAVSATSDEETSPLMSPTLLTTKTPLLSRSGVCAAKSSALRVFGSHRAQESCRVTAALLLCDVFEEEEDAENEDANTTTSPPPLRTRDVIVPTVIEILSTVLVREVHRTRFYCM